MLLLFITGFTVAASLLLHRGWHRKQPMLTAVGLHVAVFLVSWLSMVVAAARKKVVGSSARELGFFGGPDDYYYSPTYLGEDDWWHLLGILPLVALALVWVADLKAGASQKLLRRLLVLLVLYPVFGLALLVASEPYDQEKPRFQDQNLTLPKYPVSHR